MTDVLLDTVVEGDTAGCRSAAGRLRRLAVALEGACEVAAAQSRLPHDVFDGLAGAAFRARAVALARPGAVQRDRCRHLAAALEDLATAIGHARFELDVVRGTAGDWLFVDAAGIHPPSAIADAQTRAAWTRAVTGVARVRREEARAQAAYEAALHRWAAAPARHPPAPVRDGHHLPPRPPPVPTEHRRPPTPVATAPAPHHPRRHDEIGVLHHDAIGTSHHADPIGPGSTEAVVAAHPGQAAEGVEPAGPCPPGPPPGGWPVYDEEPAHVPA